MTAPKARRQLTGRLGFQLMLLLAIVLLPLTVISVVKSAAVVDEARARSEAALMGATSRAAAGELQHIQEARGVTAAFARMIGLIAQDDAACSKFLQNNFGDRKQFVVVGYVPLNGKMRCSSMTSPYDLAGTALFRQLTAEPRPSFAVSRKSPISGLSVVAVSHPVIDDAGTFQGIIIATLAHSALNTDLGGDDQLAPLSVITFDRDGEVLTWPAALEDVPAVLPRDTALSDLTGSTPVAFSAQSKDGRERVFSVVPLVPGELYALGTWPTNHRLWAGPTIWMAPILFPVLLSLASLLLAWFGVEQLVIRHIRKLSASINSFASGSRTVGDIDVAKAPLEVREMAKAYERMTETILYDEAELEDMVHQKEVLMREVHHRVKNNLQLIASIMNMQMRQARTLEAKEMMKGLQDRVMSLATVHRELYQTTGQTDIHVDELLADIVRQTVKLGSGAGRWFDVRTDFADIRMTPDQAVPLAMLLTEALTNAMKYSGSASPAAPQLDVTLKRQGATEAVLKVANTLPSDAAQPSGSDDTTSGIGNQLLDAFAMQLGARMERGEDGNRYRLCVTFELRPLAEAEARNSVATDPRDDPDSAAAQ